MLKEIVFQPSYFKTRNQLFKEFYKPCLENSIKYDRITGYFGSSIFLVINEALKYFIERKGHIRIICSPILKEEDIKAIKDGYDGRENNIISKQIDDIVYELQKNYPNSSDLLAKLISAKILDIRLVIFSNHSEVIRLMHDKAGIFTDEFNNKVAFRGSMNETFNGVSEYGNSESFDVFTNWEDSKDIKRVNLVLDQFENMWAGNEPNVQTFNIPDTSIEKIKSFNTSKSVEELLDIVDVELNNWKLKWEAEIGINKRIIKQHQENILNNWENNNRCGIFEMCTGSGKTFTALCAIRDSFRKKEVPIIMVPSKLLFFQWESELQKVFAEEIVILKVGAGNKLNTAKLQRYTQNNLNINRCILVTYQSASRELFFKNVNWGKHIFLICDEVHNIGSTQNSKLLDMNIGPRIGLSATPERYFDQKITKKIMDFFKGIIEPKYQIGDAIKDGVLSEYFYEIFEVELSQREQEKWNKLSKEIGKKLSSIKENQNIHSIKGLETLLFKRSDIIKKAEEKVYIAEDILVENFQPCQKWLVYLDDSDQILTLKRILEKHAILAENIFEYHTQTNNDLDQTINHFRVSGGILLAINCLDEGVDIPSIDHAIILSSSKNPRQYIQRRGRVLRKSPNKNFAYIYDCFVYPNLLKNDSYPNLSIINSEIARAMKFAENAINIGIKNKIDIIMNKNGIDVSEGEYDNNEWWL